MKKPVLITLSPPESSRGNEESADDLHQSPKTSNTLNNLNRRVISLLNYNDDMKQVLQDYEAEIGQNNGT